MSGASIHGDYPAAYDNEPSQPVVVTEKACPICTAIYPFYGTTPDPGWVCVPCRRRCGDCGGSGHARRMSYGELDEQDICDECAGSGKAA